MGDQPELNFDRRHASQCPAEIVEKIRKLLRMEQGGAESEVDNALRLARQLADKHNVDLNSIDAAESAPFATLTFRAVRCALKSADDDYASYIVQKFFNVDPIFKKSWDDQAGEVVMDVVLVGTIIDVEIAVYVFEFLRPHFKACWRRRNKRLKKRRAFIEGIYLGLCSRLREDRELVVSPEARSALVLSRKAYVESLFPKLQTKEVSSKTGKKAEAARNAGWHLGRNTNIRQPLAGATAPKPLLLK